MKLSPALRPVLSAAVAALLLVPLGASPAFADSAWPQWRGPEATGVSPDGAPPTTWSETENVRFKVAVPGKGLASPVVWGDLVFLLTAVPTGEAPPKPEEPEEKPEGWRPPAARPEKLRFEVLALARADGGEVWRRTAAEAAPHEGTHADGSWASNSPVTDGETLFAHFGSRGLFAYDLSGGLRWHKDLGKMSTRRGFGEGSSPALHGDLVVVNWDHEGDSFIVALDKKTGEERWRKTRDEITSWSTPLVVEHGGRAQVVVAATGHTRGYDLATGDVVWQAGGMTVNVVPTPVAADGLVYVMSGFRGNAAQAIRLEAAKGDVTGTEAVVWSYGRDTPYVPSPLLYGDQIYFLDNNRAILSSLDSKTGAVHFTEQRLEGLQGVYASPVGADGRIYVPGRNGATAVLRHGKTFEVLAVNQLDDGFDASPALAGGELYLRGRSHLYCLEEEEKPAEPAAQEPPVKAR